MLLQQVFGSKLLEISRICFGGIYPLFACIGNALIVMQARTFFPTDNKDRISGNHWQKY